MIRPMRTVLLALLVALELPVGAQDTATVGRSVTDVALRNVDGRTLSFDSFPDAKGFIVVFTCNHCPFAKLYPQRFNGLNARYAPQGVPFLAINSMDTLVYEEENFAAMKDRARSGEFSFPYLYDDLQLAARTFGAEHTPQAFVVWKEGGQWVVRYAGAIDDNGLEPEKATPFVANAVDDLLAGRPVSRPVTESFGCRIFLRALDQ